MMTASTGGDCRASPRRRGCPSPRCCGLSAAAGPLGRRHPVCAGRAVPQRGDPLRRGHHPVHLRHRGRPDDDQRGGRDGCKTRIVEHVAVAADPRAADFVLNALDPDNPASRCQAIAPIHEADGILTRTCTCTPAPTPTPAPAPRTRSAPQTATGVIEEWLNKSMKLLRAASALAATAMAAAALVLTGTAGASAAVRERPPTSGVPWRWWDGAAHQLTTGLADPPGLNRDDCQPSRHHPQPGHPRARHRAQRWQLVGDRRRGTGGRRLLRVGPDRRGHAVRHGLDGRIRLADRGIERRSWPPRSTGYARLTGAEHVDAGGTFARSDRGLVRRRHRAGQRRADRDGLGADPTGIRGRATGFVTAMMGVLSAETTQRDAEATTRVVGRRRRPVCTWRALCGGDLGL